MWTKEFRQILGDEFRRRKEKNHRFSVRQFAGKADLSVGLMSELLSGKKECRLPPERVSSVLANVGVPSCAMTCVQIAS